MSMMQFPDGPIIPDKSRGKPSRDEHNARTAALIAERDNLRAEVERLNRIVSKFIATEDGTDWAARAEKAEAELAKEQARLDWLERAGKGRFSPLWAQDWIYIRSAIDAAIKESP